MAERLFDSQEEIHRDDRKSYTEGAETCHQDLLRSFLTWRVLIEPP